MAIRTIWPNLFQGAILFRSTLAFTNKPMPDHTSNKTKTSPSVPSKPPKALPRDYSALPQKPISLKHKKKKPMPKGSKIKQKKDKTSAEKNAPDSWNLEQLPNEVKTAIVAGAESNGLTIPQYLQYLVLHQEDKPTPAQTVTDKLILDRIEAIEERLKQVEQQRGFWSRFWEQVMNDSDAS
jgi:hypothetical protein